MPLCIFGHMHHRVRNGALRKMLALGTPLVHPETGAASIAREVSRGLHAPQQAEGCRETRGSNSAAGASERDLETAAPARGTRGSDSAAGAASRSLSALTLKPCSAVGASQAGSQAARGPSREGGGYADASPQGPRVTVHVNAAVVPRIRWSPRGCASCVVGASKGALGSLKAQEHKKCTEHHFVVIELQCRTGKVDFVDDVWVEVGACAGAVRTAGVPAVTGGEEAAAEGCQERRFQLGQVQENEGRVFSAG